MNLNPVIQGWRGYYGKTDPQFPAVFLQKINRHIRRRLFIFLRNKQKRTRIGRCFVYEWLENRLPLGHRNA
ncbi:group II intron maturase-specific domain-containing protein [Paenibacillus hamazuiensis]|uniref:group II intron maturase-specific domain-containing protein n=1 Tax=Paenibacillus hamazuiensis TaxID=2936508 RepID=UPI003B847DDC